MFETFFKRPFVFDRYRAAPFFDAREKFLEQCAMAGYSRSWLKRIAWMLMSLAHSIDIDQDKLTICDIELAVDGRAHFKHSKNNTFQDCKKTRQRFVHIATEWLRSLGRLEILPAKEIPFAEQIAEFIRYQREDRGFSTGSISLCCRHLARFFASLNTELNSLSKISIADVDAYMEAKGNEGWKRASLASLTTSLRRFFRYAEGQGWCKPGIAAIIESPRIYAQEGIPEGPKWEDVQRLLASTSGDSPADIRNHAILMLLAVYGLRRSEVAQLLLDDLDWLGERITVRRSKRHCTQFFPLVSSAGEAILRYLREVRPRCAHRTLFLSLTAPIRPISVTSITCMVHSRLSALGVILPHSGPHCMRHACASHLLDSGFSLKQIGDQLGHLSADSTLDYIKVDLVRLREVAELDLRRLL